MAIHGNMKVSALGADQELDPKGALALAAAAVILGPSNLLIELY